MPTYATNQVLEPTAFYGATCSCDPFADERCEFCRNRHKLVGQAVMPYQKDGPLLSVENVWQKYGHRTILENVNVKIRHMTRANMPTGRIISFLGPSGCGKTTLLRILAGLEKPSQGGVYINSKHDAVKAGLVGLVMQHYPLYRNRTIMSNLMVAANQFDPKTAHDRAKSMLDRFKLADQAEKYPIQLSGGQRQRIAVAQQLLCSDHYLLMDEPTAGLDPVSKKDVGTLVQETANSGEGVTIIIVTHDIPTAVALSDTIWLMGRKRDENGKIVSGAYIVDTYDLIECGLTWNPNVRKHPAYAPLVQELMDRFDVL
jgi:polar amino acid transport system ATP-binding protein/sulfate transport system ATP-binding protein